MAPRKKAEEDPRRGLRLYPGNLDEVCSLLSISKYKL